MTSCLDKYRKFIEAPDNHPISYRMEMRVDTVNMLDSVRLVDKNELFLFKKVESSKAYRCVKKAVCEFLNEIKEKNINNTNVPPNISNIAKASYMELVLQGFILKGDFNKHWVFNTEMKSILMEAWGNTGFDFLLNPENNPPLNINFPPSYTNNKMFMGLYELFKVSSRRREWTDKRLFELCNVNDKRQGIIIVLQTLIEDLNTITGNDVIDFSDSKIPKKMKSDKIILFNNVYYSLFNLTNPKFDKYLYFNLWKTLNWQFNDITMEEVREHFEITNIEWFYDINTISKKTNRVSKIDYYGELSSNEKVAIDLITLLDEELKKMPTDKSKKGFPDHELAKILFAVGLKKHDDLQWPAIFNMLSLGMYATRTQGQVVYKVSKLRSLSYESLLNLIEEASKYDPRKISVKERLDEVKKFHPQLASNQRFIEGYQLLHTIQMEKYVHIEGNGIKKTLLKYYGFKEELTKYENVIELKSSNEIISASEEFLRNSEVIENEIEEVSELREEVENNTEDGDEVSELREDTLSESYDGDAPLFNEDSDSSS